MMKRKASVSSLQMAITSFFEELTTVIIQKVTVLEG